MEETNVADGGESLLSPEPATTTEAWYGEDNKEFVGNKGWEGPDDVIKSYREIEKTFSGRVKMPTPESSAEEIRAFYQKTGCPENPEGYEISEEVAGAFRNEGVENEMKNIAYEMGVSKQAFEAIVKGYYDKMNADLAHNAEISKAELQKEFGDKYDGEMAIAKRFYETCSDEFKQLLESTGLGNSAIVIKEFINKGKQTMADTLVKGEVSGDKEDGYEPQYKTSPEMYAAGESPESEKARNWFKARGHVY